MEPFRYCTLQTFYTAAHYRDTLRQARTQRQRRQTPRSLARTGNAHQHHAPRAGSRRRCQTPRRPARGAARSARAGPAGPRPRLPPAAPRGAGRCRALRSAHFRSARSMMGGHGVGGRRRARGVGLQISFTSCCTSKTPSAHAGGPMVPVRHQALHQAQQIGHFCKQPAHAVSVMGAPSVRKWRVQSRMGSGPTCCRMAGMEPGCDWTCPSSVAPSGPNCTTSCALDRGLSPARAPRRCAPASSVARTCTRVRGVLRRRMRVMLNMGIAHAFAAP